MVTTKNKPVPTTEELIAGMRRAVGKVIAKAKRDDETLVIVRDGKIVHVKARDL